MNCLVNGDVSFWWRDAGRTLRRPSLPGDTGADVCIVGAGYTGLWTAYYLAQADPSLKIVVVEARFAGYGASGRNGGWLTNSVTGGVEQYVARHGLDGANRQQQAMNEAVDEVVAVTQREGLDADVRHGGELILARNPAQLSRLRSHTAHSGSSSGSGWTQLTADEARAKVGARGVLGAAWQPHCATVHPVKLAAGLAAAVERLGVTIYEDTRVDEIRPGIVQSRRGAVRAGVVIRATEGFTAHLRGQRRTWLPMNSSLIVTEPLPQHVWDQIGWDAGEALGDSAHVYFYAQRAAGDRIAIGGRGVPYRFGSRFDEGGHTPTSTIASLRSVLDELFPVLKGFGVDHAWSGVLGVPRDWSATVDFDKASGVGFAGGYVGTGVATTNLAGRTLSDLVLGRETDLVSLPWVGHRARRWEPEPVRWLGVSAVYAAYRAADKAEASGRTENSRWARVANAVSGR